jgi:hypothetical protein
MSHMAELGLLAGALAEQAGIRLLKSRDNALNAASLNSRIARSGWSAGMRRSSGT